MTEQTTWFSVLLNHLLVNSVVSFQIRFTIRCIKLKEKQLPAPPGHFVAIAANIWKLVVVRIAQLVLLRSLIWQINVYHYFSRSVNYVRITHEDTSASESFNSVHSC